LSFFAASLEFAPGIVFCQAEHYFRNQRRQEQFWTRTTMLVSWVLVLSMLKVSPDSIRQ
jgi:hypothetical protein